MALVEAAPGSSRVLLALLLAQACGSRSYSSCVGDMLTSAPGGIAPIAPLTFHSLRMTYASLRCACGDDIRYVSAQIGHGDPRFTLKVHAQATKRRDRLSETHRRAYDRAIEWARVGANPESEHVPATAEAKTPPERGFQ
jgi:integrase